MTGTWRSLAKFDELLIQKKRRDEWLRRVGNCLVLFTTFFCSTDVICTLSSLLQLHYLFYNIHVSSSIVYFVCFSFTYTYTSDAAGTGQFDFESAKGLLFCLSFSITKKGYGLCNMTNGYIGIGEKMKREEEEKVDIYCAPVNY